MPERPTIRAAILGASGYTGGELVRLLSEHPAVEIAFLGARSAAGRPLAESQPHLSSLGDRTLEPIETGAIAERADVALLALPHGTSAEVAQVQGEIWKGQCPQCWTACEAYQSIIGNGLALRRAPAEAGGERRAMTGLAR